MSTKFTYRLLIISIGAILIVGILSFSVFLPYEKRQIQAQNAKLSIAPNPVNAGETIQVNGFDYPATTKVRLYVQGNANRVVEATTNKGGFFNVPLTLPRQYSSGPAFIYAVSDNFTTKAKLNYIKSAVTYHAPARRSTVSTFKGAGFVTHEVVNYVLMAGNNTIRGSQMTDSEGRFTVVLKLPDMPLGSKAMFMASDELKKPIAIPITYSPQVGLDSFVGAANATLNVTGRGYKSKEQVRILFQGKQVALVVTDSKGTFSHAFKIPTTADASSYYNNVQVIGQSSKAAASDSFQVVPSVSSSTMTVTPGQSVTVTGSQFTPKKHVQIVLYSPTQSASSVGTVLQNTLVSSSGTFRVSFSAPRNIARKKVYSVVYIDVASGHNVNTYFKIL